MSIPASAKYEIIREMTRRDNNLLNVVWLCKAAGVSRSGYYHYLETDDLRQRREEDDRHDFLIILEAYQFRGYNKGARGIYMRLLHMRPPVHMNIKKIRRLMKKNNLFCPIRKANPYRRAAKAIATAHVSPNLLNREFESRGPRKVLLTDITYIINGKAPRCYMCTIIDACTKEILAWTLSISLEVDFVLDAANIMLEDHGVSISAETLIHSDQGSHYKSVKFVRLVKDSELRQSMSRKANCWDNAPQESFFGHMKDEIDISWCSSFDEISRVIADWTDYYNNDRYQWDLARLSPVEYYSYRTTGEYPLTIPPAKGRDKGND
jgi:transposase InsO family protein